MTISDNHQAFLALVRLGLGHHADMLPHPIDWSAIHTIAEKQGLLAVALDGINQLPEDQRPPKVFMLKWIGEVMQGYEQRYELYRKAVEDLAAWYHAHGYRMMLLKGLACGKNWPKPEHRPYGDIDIYLFGQQKEADALMVQEFKVQGFKIDNSHHHHTVFQWQGFTVENHYDFVNVHHHKSNEELEALLKSIVFRVERLESVKRGEFKVYLPPANFSALFLLWHAMNHFGSTEMTLRQLLDWGFFVEKQGKEVDWEWFDGVLERFWMKQMFQIFNAICVEDLGFNLVESLGFRVETQLKSVEFIKLKERVLNDIMELEFSKETPKHVWNRVPFKYRRWKANEWKHELCYTDSMKSAFWYGVKKHLMKPASI